uniref:Uncharacterized protein n=1 Tax=viral metagenome TaxID=1070528 RepID=A0A6C0I5B3_9ZZZZ
MDNNISLVKPLPKKKKEKKEKKEERKFTLKHCEDGRGDKRYYIKTEKTGKVVDPKTNRCVAVEGVLFTAVQEGNISETEEAIEAGANVNKVRNGRTSLHWACEMGSYPIVELLLRSGAKINIKDTEGKTPLDLAIESGNKEIEDLLLKPLEEKKPPEEKKKPPEEEKKSYHKVMVINPKTNRYVSADSLLFRAVQEGNVSETEQAIKAGANVNAAKNGWTSLHWACKMGIYPVVDLLLRSGAKINIKDTEGNTPLHISCQYDHVDIANLLITSGASINSKNNMGMTPLDLAIESGNQEVEDLLLKSGEERVSGSSQKMSRSSQKGGTKKACKANSKSKTKSKR